MGGLGISREDLLQQLIAAATQNPAAQGFIPGPYTLKHPQGWGGLRENPDGTMRSMQQMPPIPPGSFNPNSPASIERGANTTRNPFATATGMPLHEARGMFGHAAGAAQLMRGAPSSAGPGYGSSNPMNPFGQGGATAEGLLTGDPSKQKNPLQQIGSAIKTLVSFLIDLGGGDDTSKQMSGAPPSVGPMGGAGSSGLFGGR